MSMDHQSEPRGTVDGFGLARPDKHAHPDLTHTSPPVHRRAYELLANFSLRRDALARTGSMLLVTTLFAPASGVSQQIQLPAQPPAFSDALEERRWIVGTVESVQRVFDQLATEPALKEARFANVIHKSLDMIANYKRLNVEGGYIEPHTGDPFDIASLRRAPYYLNWAAALNAWGFVDHSGKQLEGLVEITYVSSLPPDAYQIADGDLRGFLTDGAGRIIFPGVLFYQQALRAYSAAQGPVQAPTRSETRPQVPPSATALGEASGQTTSADNLVGEWIGYDGGTPITMRFGDNQQLDVSAYEAWRPVHAQGKYRLSVIQTRIMLECTLHNEDGEVTSLSRFQFMSKDQFKWEQGKLPNDPPPQFTEKAIYFSRRVLGKGRLIDNADGTVTDRASGLMWTKNATVAGPISWADALEYARQMNAGGHPNYGYTDWRLPSISQFETLIDFEKRGVIALPDGHPFQNPQRGQDKSGDGFYWTSSRATPAAPVDAYDDPSLAATANSAFMFSLNSRHSYAQSQEGSFSFGFPVRSEFYVWPVRVIHEPLNATAAR